MRILAGQDQEYEGTLQLSPGIKVGYLQQEPVLDMKSTVLENIAPALAPTKAMLTEFEEVTLSFLPAWACSESAQPKHCMTSLATIKVQLLPGYTHQWRKATSKATMGLTSEVARVKLIVPFP